MTTHPFARLQNTAVTRAVWLIVAVGTLVVVVTAVPLRYQMLLDDHYGFGAPLATLGISLRFFAVYFVFWELLLAVGAWGVGMIIAWRKSNDWFALLLAITLMLISFMPPLMNGLIRDNAAWTMPVILLRMFGFTGLIVVFSLFPNGRLAHPWLRFVLLGWFVNAFISLLFIPEGLADTAIMPNTNTQSDALKLVYQVVWFLPVMVAQWHRYRRVDTAVEQQQTKWVVWGFTIPVLISFFNAILLVGVPSLRTDLVLNTVVTLTLGVALLLSTFLIPLTLAFAIFRYRLWQIDIILNRTLVYGGLTTGVTAVYILLVGGFGTLAVSEQSNLAALVVVAMIVVWGIRPLHHRLQTQVDKWLPPPSPTKQAATQNKVPRLMWLRTAWGIYILLTLLLFAAGLVHQAQNGFWQQPAAEILVVAPLLANPFGTDFFLENDLYFFVLVGGYLQAAVFVTVGLFLFWHKSGDVMGVLASWMLIAIGLGFTATIIFLPVLDSAWHLPTSLFQAGLFASAFLFLCLFPNGRFYPHWTRTAAIIWLVYVLLWLPFPHLNLHRATVIWPAVVFGAVVWLGVVAQLLRYRRISSADEKQQTKWVIAGFVVANFGLAGIAFLLSLKTSHSATLLTAAILALALMPIFIPLSIGVALLRYRLWQIDIILNRSLVYGGLTAVILTIYALTVGGLSLLFHEQNNLLISLLATGLIAVFFQPVRERLQRGANRLIYGERDDPYLVLSKLGTQLQTTATPEAMLQSVVETIATTLKLPYVAIQLADEQGRLDGAAIGQAVAELVELPLRYQKETVGYLLVSPRSPNESFTEREQRLLADMAGQTGAIAYSVRLTAALQRSRERLVLAREEERRRIRRDLHDELGPTLASQTFALDTILDLLETDPQAAANLLQSLKAQNQRTVADVRRLVYELRPPALDELGVVGALQAYVAQVNGRSPLSIAITAQPDPLPPLPAAVEVAAYRIALEAITNVVRHAQARHCDVCLRVVANGRAQLQIEITDNGIGLPADLHVGVGLTSMRERAEELGGSLSITKLTEGTRLMAQLPLEMATY